MKKLNTFILGCSLLLSLNANSENLIKSNISVSNITATSFEISWTEYALENENSLYLIDEDGDIVTPESITGTTAVFSNLKKSTGFKVIFKDNNDNICLEYNACTPNYDKVDFGDQIENSGFENWELISNKLGSEPINWNSFATLETSLGTTGEMARTKQIETSSEIRPFSTGQYSSNIYNKKPISFLPIWANGNMTTGRIHAGDTDATSVKNYNYSDIEDPNFNQTISMIPDSVSLWVKFVPGNASKSPVARASFIIHGEGLVKEPDTLINDLISASAEIEYNIYNEWVRFSIPFDTIEANIENIENNVKYILASFTTNKTPGGNTGKTDNVYIDDISLIYKPTLAVNEIEKTSYTQGDELDIPYELNGSMSVTNIIAGANRVWAEIALSSDENWENPIKISEKTITDESGIINAIVPEDVTPGSYKMRVVTSNYPMTQESPQVLSVSERTGIEESALAEVVLYPNPATETLFFKGGVSGDIYFNVYNMYGQTVKKGLTSLTNGLNVSDLTSGVYYIEITSEKQTSVLRFIKE